MITDMMEKEIINGLKMCKTLMHGLINYGMGVFYLKCLPDLAELKKIMQRADHRFKLTAMTFTDGGIIVNFEIIG